ncbi:MAG: ATP-dependent DNA helicase RecG, partial [Bacteroidales bacterium]|nr:ATP-dependent DNA helicase RecG [Bacteroidales bacterium]
MATELTYVPGVGPKRAELFASEIHVSTDEELLHYFPYRYVDKSKIYRIADLDGNMPYILLKGQFTVFEEVGQGTRAHRFRALFTDGSGVVECLWFQGIKWIKESLLKHNDYLVFGQPKMNEFSHTLQIMHPEVESAQKN